MSVGLTHIWVIDFVANIFILCVSFYLIFKGSRIRALRPHTPLWMYLHWQMAALGVFALSHSIGHIARRVLLLEGKEALWEEISPFTGGINSLMFVVVAILSFLYKDLENASERYGTLKEAKMELELSLRKLRETSLQMEKDAQEIFIRNKELTVLNKIALAVSTSLEMDRVLAAIVREVRDFLGLDLIGIYLVGGDGILLKVSEGIPPELAARLERRTLDEPWLKRKVMGGEPFYASEPIDSHQGVMDDALKGVGVQAWAAVPLMAKGKVVGVLTVGSHDYEGINEKQIETLMTVGGYVGVVIENSSLYQELMQKVEDLERFRKFSVGREMRIIELKERLKTSRGDG